MSSVLAFRNHQQVVLWQLELKGQLSDGYWENARPHDHWEVWCDDAIQVVADPTDVGRNFPVIKDNYNFVASDLVEVVGHRMEAYCRLSFRYPTWQEVQLLESFLDTDGDWRGPPKWEGAYYDQIRQQLTAYDQAQVRAAAEAEELYDRKRLLADLRDIKGIVRTWRRTP